MGLFSRRDDSAANDKRKQKARPRADAAGDDADPAAALRVRARRRLIGAAALLLAAVIIVPLVLDPAPRPAADNIPIDIPGEKQPFTPRIALPPVPDPGQTPLAPPPDTPEPDKSKADAGTKDGAAKAAPAKADAAPKAEVPKARPQPDAKPAPKEAPPKSAEPKARPTAAEAKPADAKGAESKVGEGLAKTKAPRLVLQAAALSTDNAAQELSERLRKAGFAPFTEKVETADGVRFRVRVGPYATRDEAQRAQAKLRALGVSATMVNT